MSRTSKKNLQHVDNPTPSAHSESRGNPAKSKVTKGSASTAAALKEKLAAIEHERWADWQAWVHKVFWGATFNDWKKIMENWERQIATPYAELSDKEKASDMEQVDRYWPLVERYIATQVNEARIDELEELQTYYDYLLPKVIKERIKELIKELQSLQTRGSTDGG